MKTRESLSMNWSRIKLQGELGLTHGLHGVSDQCIDRDLILRYFNLGVTKSDNSRREVDMIRAVIFICLIAAVFLFVFQNLQTVEVKFLLWTINISQALILFMTPAIGLIGGYLLSYPMRRPKAKIKNWKEPCLKQRYSIDQLFIWFNWD